MFVCSNFCSEGISEQRVRVRVTSTNEVMRGRGKLYAECETICYNDNELCMNHTAQRSIETDTESEMQFKMEQQLPVRNCGRNVPKSAWNTVPNANSYKTGVSSVSLVPAHHNHKTYTRTYRKAP